MIPAQLPSNENQRLAALARYQVLDTMPEPSFDDLTKLAAYICQTPIALISLIDEHRQWFKSKVGITAIETPRDMAFCAHAILEAGVFEVSDALTDVRFMDNPLVTEDPNVRFYAGSPLQTLDGMPIGTLCVIDQVPRSLSQEQRVALSAVSRQVMTQLELRMRLEQEHQYKDYFEYLLEIASNGMVVIDPDGTIVQANTHIFQQFGYRREELLGQTIEVLIPERFRHHHPHYRMAYFDSPSMRTMGSGRDLYGLRKDGSEFPLDIGLAPLVTSKGSRVLASVIDTTVQKQTMEALLQSESLNALILQSAGDGIFGLDTHGNTTFVNPAGAAMLGYTSEELLGVPMHVTMHHTKPDGSPYPRESCPMYAAFKDGIVHQVDDEVLWRKDGSSFPVEYTSTPIRDQMGTLQGAVVTFKDITDRQQAEFTLRERNKMVALDAEVGRVIQQSHDIEGMLQGCAEALVQNLDAALARIWILNTSEQILELRASAGLYTHQDGAHGRIPVGQFKIGKIASEKRPHLTNDVIGDPRVPDQEWVKQESLVAFAGYPLMSGQNVLGVMGMFSRRPLTEYALRSLQTVSDRITTAIERHAAEQAHLKLSELNKQILNSSGEGIWGLDLNGKTTFVNPAAAQTLGYEPAELLGTMMHMKVHHTKPDGSCYPGEDCPMYKAYLLGATQTVEDEVLWRKDGTSFPVEYTSTPIRDDRGQLIGAVVTFRDITERKRHQEQLNRVIEAVPSGLLIVNENGAIVMANQTLEEQFGYERGELLGQTVECLVPERFREQYPDYRARVFAQPEARTFGEESHLYARRKDGLEFLVEIGLCPVPSESEILMLASVKDVTARKKQETTLCQYMDDLYRSNQELDDFAYITSHDLKEPLRGIYNYSTILLEDYGHQLNAEGQSRCETLLRLSKRMEDLINSLLYYSRVGRTELAVTSTDVQKILDEILDSLDIRLQECGVAVRIPRSLPIVYCDHVRIGEIFRNLITNAMKYNDKHEKWIEIGYFSTTDGAPDVAFSDKKSQTESFFETPKTRSEIDSERDASLVFYVRDNGIGIKEKHLSSIFRIFKRLHGREKFGGGTGAGLTITKKLIERHGGQVWVDSTYGVGSTFFFTLQRSVPDGMDATTTHSLS
ncbi:PAS domain S-box protein [Candidatus Nitrospira salsa]